MSVTVFLDGDDRICRVRVEHTSLVVWSRSRNRCGRVDAEGSVEMLFSVKDLDLPIEREDHSESLDSRLEAYKSLGDGYLLNISIQAHRSSLQAIPLNASDPEWDLNYLGGSFTKLLDLFDEVRMQCPKGGGFGEGTVEGRVCRMWHGCKS